MLGVPWVLACDRCDPPSSPTPDAVVRVTASTVIEDVLADAHAACGTEWVLRLDDDETLSAPAVSWLWSWLRSDQTGVSVIGFPRANLWGGEGTMLAEEYMWPDPQMRLTRRGAETRSAIHQGLSPDRFSPAVILHHKFLVKSREDREAIARRYEATSAGCGLGEHYVRFSLPEVAFGDTPAVTETVHFAGQSS